MVTDKGGGVEGGRANERRDAVANPGSVAQQSASGVDAAAGALQGGRGTEGDRGDLLLGLCDKDSVGPFRCIFFACVLCFGFIKRTGARGQEKEGGDGELAEHGT